MGIIRTYKPKEANIKKLLTYLKTNKIGNFNGQKNKKHV